MAAFTIADRMTYNCHPPYSGTPKRAATDGNHTIVRRTRRDVGLRRLIAERSRWSRAGARARRAASLRPAVVHANCETGKASTHPAG